MGVLPIEHHESLLRYPRVAQANVGSLVVLESPQL